MMKHSTSTPQVVATHFRAESGLPPPHPHPSPLFPPCPSKWNSVPTRVDAFSKALCINFRSLSLLESKASEAYPFWRLGDGQERQKKSRRTNKDMDQHYTIQDLGGGAPGDGLGVRGAMFVVFFSFSWDLYTILWTRHSQRGKRSSASRN